MAFRIIAISLIMFFSLLDISLAGDVRLVKVRVAADEVFRSRNGWEAVAKERINAVSGVMEKNVGIQFEILDIVPWNSKERGKQENQLGFLSELLADLEEKMPPGPADLVIGFSGKRNPVKNPSGMGKAYERHAVICDGGGDGGSMEQLLAFVTAHEVMHNFGMFHVAENDSIMGADPETGFVKFDEHTLRHMRLMRRFDFRKGIDSLTPDAVREAGAIHKEGRAPGMPFPVADAHISRGDRLKKEAKLNDAITEYRAAIALDDTSFARKKLAYVLVEKKQFAEAAAEFRKAVALEPGDAFAHYNLAGVLEKTGKNEEALAENREAVKLAPEDAMCRGALWDRLFALGRQDEGMSDMRKFIALKPDDAEAHAALGARLLEAGQPEEAITEFRSALRLSPGKAMLHYSMGDAFTKMKKYPEAVAEYRTAARSFPDMPQPRYQAGKVLLYNIQDPQEAVKEFREFVRLSPKHAEGHFQMATALFNANKADEAIASFETVLELDPKHESARMSLEAMYLDRSKGLHTQKQFEKAAAALRRAVALNPKNPRSRYQLGVLLAEMNKYPEALAEMRVAARIAPGVGEIYHANGNILMLAGDPLGAAGSFREAARLMPNNAEMYYKLGTALLRLNKTEEARSEFEKALRIKPDHAGAKTALEEISKKNNRVMN